MDAPFPPRQLRKVARWCRNAAWGIAMVGLVAILLDGYASVGEYMNASTAHDSTAILFPLTSFAGTLLALAGTIFYTVLLLAISGMLEHYALTQVNALGGAAQHTSLSD